MRDTWIAEDCGVSKNTVHAIRENLESAGQIDRLDKLLGKDGKEYPREIVHPKVEKKRWRQK